MTPDGGRRRAGGQVEIEIEIEPTEGKVILRPVRTGLSFREARAKLFAEKHDLLARLSDA